MTIEGLAAAPSGLEARFASIGREVAGPMAAVVDRDCLWPTHTIDALKDEQLTGLNVPTRWGGLGQGTYALALAGEALGRHCPSSALCFGMHCVATAVIARNATDSQGADFLTAIAAGRHLTTLSLSEPETGAFFYYPQTRIERAGADRFRVSGFKTFVTNGGHADSYVVSGLERNGHQDDDAFSCLIVDADAPNMTWGAPWQGLGMRGNSSITLTLEDTEVPAANLLGNSGDQIWYVFHVVAPYFLAAMSGSYLGIAARALEIAVEHVKQREYTHTGSTLAQASTIQHRIGELWASVARTRALVHDAGRKSDADHADALPAMLSAKAEVANCAVDTVNAAMTLCGGQAYRDGSELHRLLRDARGAHVMAPTTDLLRIWTGRTVLNQPLLAD